MQKWTHLCSSAVSNLPLQHLVQSIFTVFTIKLLHEKLEDNGFPRSAQQQRTWHSSFVDFKQLMLLEHTVQRAPLLLDWCELVQSLQIWEEFCVYRVSDMKAADEMLAISLRPLWKCDPEEFYTWKNMKIPIIVLAINMSESGKRCDGARQGALWIEPVNRNRMLGLRTVRWGQSDWMPTSTSTSVSSWP